MTASADASPLAALTRTFGPLSPLNNSSELELFSKGVQLLKISAVFLRRRALPAGRLGALVDLFIFGRTLSVGQ